MKSVPPAECMKGFPLFYYAQSILARGYLAIPESGNEQLLTSLRTAWATELSLDKKVTVYDDLLDSLRLALRAYSII